VQQHVPLPQPLEDRLRARPRHFRPVRVEAREAQRRPVRLIDELVQPHQVHRPVDLVQGLAGQAELAEQEQAELAEQEVVQIAGAAGDHFQAQRLTVVARAQTAAQGLAQVGDVVLVHVEVGVARHPKLREGLDRASRKQFGQVGPYDTGQQDEPLPAATQCIGQADHTRQHARHLDDGDQVLAAEDIAPAQAGDEVQRLVGDLREGVAGVQAHRHQKGPHLGLEEALDPVALRCVAFGVVEHHDALALQRRHDLVVEQRVLVVDQLVGRGRHLLQLLRCSSCRETPEPGRRLASTRSATRTSKNSSRLDETMVT